MSLNLDPWWDEPAYKTAQVSFSECGTFILNKLAQHDAVKLSTVIADLYRDEPPGPMDTTKFQWQISSPTWAPVRKRLRTCRPGWGGCGGEDGGADGEWVRLGCECGAELLRRADEE